MKYLYISFLLIFLVPFYTHAETVLRIGPDISVEADQVVEGDYYVSAGLFGKTVMSGTVAEDMYAMGASVIVNGEVGSDLSIFSGTSQLHASVTDDVRILAGEVTIAEDIGGDVFVIASSLSVLSTANISGDVFFFGGVLSIEGDVSGSVHGKAQSVEINGHVMGDVDLVASSGLIFGDTAVIDGSVRYTSLVPLSRSQGTEIVGDIQKAEFVATDTRQQMREILVPIFMVLFATLSVYLLAKREIELVVTSVENFFVRNFLIGCAVLLLGPLVAIILMATVLGLFVGVIVIAIVLLLYVLGLVLLSAVLGAFVVKLFTKNATVTLISILVGSIVLQLFLFIPVVGPLLLFVLYALTVGALSGRIYQSIS
jgi:hypothetical protein